MNITLFDLDNLKKSCDNMSQLIKEIKSQTNSDNDKRKLFVSRADYEESLREQKKLPQDFYYFRQFDVFIQIVYNKRLKKYQLYCENYYSFMLNEYERSPQSNNSYIISSHWEEVFELYNKCIQDIVNHNLDNGLF